MANYRLGRYDKTGPTRINAPRINESTKNADGGYAENNIIGKDISSDSIVTSPVKNTSGGNDSANYYTSDYFKSIMHYNGLYSKNDTNIYTRTYRFGKLDPYGAISTSREFLFFTKPDLNIFNIDDTTMSVSETLNPALANIPFWIDMANYKKRIISLLEASYHKDGIVDPFNHLLQNNCMSNLEIQSLSADMIDTPQNIYGVGYKYRGSSESSDDGPDFSLEFRDTRWLDVYTMFKAYEEYETLKHHGVIRPPVNYIINKIVHDQFSIYKFLVDEDMETIIYYGKMYGVAPKSLPRDIFGSTTYDNGLSYSIDFSAAFYEDMKPDIIADFNALSKDWFNAQPYEIPIYSSNLDRVDRRAATAAYIIKDSTSPTAKRSPNGYVYKLKWRGKDNV